MVIGRFALKLRAVSSFCADSAFCESKGTQWCFPENNKRYEANMQNPAFRALSRRMRDRVMLQDAHFAKPLIGVDPEQTDDLCSQHVL